ncbi:MAG TPA: hypothetical protein VKY74_23155 [Chloroflexia bacterium]|nr:hypothetical protein [Chloroflexia bacterium]
MPQIPDPAASKLLLDEPPLIVLPSLAAMIGLPEAIMLQQIHYWLRTAGKPRDGRLWIYNSYPQWVTQMPFWTPDTIRRVLQRLRTRGLILTGNYNRLAIDRTIWYTIDYAAVAALGLIARSGETPLQTWWDAERATACIPAEAIPLNRETDAWRDHHRQQGQVPAGLAAAWRQWMRRAIGYHIQHPLPARPGAPTPPPDWAAREAAAAAKAAESRLAAQKLMAAIHEMHLPKQASS